MHLAGPELAATNPVHLQALTPSRTPPFNRLLKLPEYNIGEAVGVFLEKNG